MSPLVPSLLSSALTSVWVGGILTLAVLVIVRCFPLTPAVRYRLWGLVLLGCAASSIWGLGSAVPRTSGMVPAAPTESPGEARTPAPDEALRVDGNVGDKISASTASPFSSRGELGSTPPKAQFGLSPIVATSLIGVWIIGVLIGLVLLFADATRALRIKRRGMQPGERLRMHWREFRANQSAGRNVGLVLSEDTRLPAAVGYFRPAVIAPAWLCRILSEEEIRHLLLHELVHLVRYDDWALLAQRALQVLCWWHPVLWFAGRRLETERELACDVAVARASGAREYARTLVHVAEVAQSARMMFAPGVLRGNLTHRIESLLGPARAPRSRYRVPAGIAALSTLGLGLWISPPPPPITVSPGNGPDGPAAAAVAAAAEPSHIRVARLDSTLQRFAESGFSGSVLVASGDNVVLSKGYGLADRERQIRASAETRYSAAGFTKMFTAAAILTLEHEGRLRVSDPIRKFLPEIQGSPGEVTLHQLLTHTDGLTRHQAPIYRRGRSAFVHAMIATPDSFSPGEGYRYNDFGHSLLGVIIELVSGQSYESFVRERFFIPAGLTETGFEGEGSEMAREYAGAPGAQYVIPQREYLWGRRASLGIVTTVGDMHRWLVAMRSPRVLSPAVRQRMLATHGSTDWGAEQGYGWDIHRMGNGSRLWRRVAGTPGMEGEILHDPRNDWTAVLLINSRLGWRFHVWREIAGTFSTGQQSSIKN